MGFTRPKERWVVVENGLLNGLQNGLVNGLVNGLRIAWSWFIVAIPLVWVRMVCSAEAIIFIRSSSSINNQDIAIGITIECNMCIFFTHHININKSYILSHTVHMHTYDCTLDHPRKQLPWYALWVEVRFLMYAYAWTCTSWAVHRETWSKRIINYKYKNLVFLLEFLDQTVPRTENGWQQFARNKHGWVKAP